MLNYRTITAFGLLVALLLHYVFMQSLPQLPLEKRSASPPQDPLVTTVQPTANGVDWETEVFALAFLADSALIPLPHVRLGFSSVQSTAMMKPQPDFPLYQRASLESSSLNKTQRFSELPAWQLSELPASQTQLPMVIAEVSPGATFAKEIIWRTGDGNPIPHMPRQLPMSLRAVSEEQRPTQATVLEIQQVGETMRVLLVQSSGNAALDDFALRLTGKRAAIAEGTAPVQANNDHRIFFPNEFATNKIEVEWRLAVIPEKSEKKDDGE